MTTVLTHEPISTDLPDIRPTLAGAVSTTARLGLAAGAAVAGAGAATLAAPTAATALTAAVVGAGLVTSLAANWSTCGMSVAGVVAAPKQPGRKGASTPLRRLGWHALGSVSTGAVTGAVLGALGSVTAANLSPLWLLFGWAVFALAYGLHEIGVVSMPAPMRRQQLPRHLRRTMSPWKVSLLFGAIIGPGFLIFIRSSAYYLLVLGVLAVGSPALGAAMFTVVSLGRCMPSVAAIAHTRRGGSMPGFLSVMCVVDRRVQAVTGAALVGLAAFAAISLI
ncbi:MULTISPECIES: methylamine utilization protein [unclassified Rhodococcus (in: high G+C Gram-positive bacteria)]|uniref:methylamine utilization protein n=1 Tax=unclassified Rhodococcus (in: high G+C Gram-positive bacteria) TaxID=192944 RepID=UPI00146B4240|nr:MULTISPECIES: methylamine utilization protein [unclassified Rhodococcus (in: high G+C Gram-positive bacteria)]NMD95933.1 methylamine utilization protein [Rhodococcus sp. BL-253-APC-6A1W]NME78873.1 methylamine utilization protein [Rhodococcus sp. 105337]